MPIVFSISRRLFLRGVSSLSSLVLLPVGGLLGGCSNRLKEAPLSNTPIDDGGPALVFLPELSAAPQLMLDARLRVRFLPKATDSGAPLTPPLLRAMIMTSPGSVNAAFTVMGFSAWTIAWTADGIKETRHPKLNAEVLADRMLRDLTLIHWPAAAIQRALPADTVLREDTSGRTLLRHGVTILRIEQQTTAQCRHTTLTNPIEGYVLTIEEALSAK